MSSALDRLAERAKANQANQLLGVREIDIPLDKIRFDSSQPRKAFHHLDGRVSEKDDAYITELAATIEAQGLIQAITVQEMDDGSYLVVVGECRTRAHVLLGASTIRAVIRNDLTNKGQRLLYQIAENVNRQDLTDDELAGSVLALIKGGEGMEPMSQAQISRTLGKPEGWITRLVRFGDQELQRVWVKTGIALTVENVYRLSILPKSMQVDVLRRVELLETDTEWLSKPLDRKFIDELSRLAKVNKNAGRLSPGTPNEPSPVGKDKALSVTPTPVAEVAPADSVDAGVDGWKNSINGVLVTNGKTVEAVEQGFANEISSDYLASHQPADDSANKVSSSGLTSGGYSLPAEIRADILGSSAALTVAGGPKAEVRESVQAPVSCRVLVSDLVVLLSTLQPNVDVRSALDVAQCDLILPGAVAQAIANQLAGVIVNRQEVPAVLQRELAKLH